MNEKSPELSNINHNLSEQVTILRGMGLTYAEIGRRLGITRQRAYQVINKKPKFSVAASATLKPMLTAREVADILGIHINTVRRWAVKDELKLTVSEREAIAGLCVRTSKDSCKTNGLPDKQIGSGVSLHNSFISYSTNFHLRAL